MRVAVPEKLWNLLEEAALIMGAHPKWCLSHMFQALEHLVDEGKIGVLGFQFEQAAQRLGDALEQARAKDPDRTKLHRSHKTKSGFVGIYSNGKGFRAEGRNPVDRRGVVTLGTYETAEDAALARYHHHKRHGLPYGRMEEEIERMRETEPNTREWSEERIKHEVIWSCANLQKMPLEGLTEEERALESIDPMLPAKPPKPAQKLAVMPPRPPRPAPTLAVTPTPDAVKKDPRD